MPSHKPKLSSFLKSAGYGDATLEGECQDAADELMRYPHAGAFKDLNASHFERLMAIRDGVFRRTLFLALLPSALLYRTEAPEFLLKWLQDSFKPQEIEVPFDSWRELSSWNWTLTRVLEADQKDAFLRTLLIGYGAPLLKPSLVNQKSLDEQAQAQIAIAANLAAQRYNCETTCFFCIPLVSPLSQPIRGPSLGLPVFLGMCAAAKTSTHYQLFATGELDAKGRILIVTRVAQKAARARAEGAKGFLYPSAARAKFKTQEGMELLPVNDVDTAWGIFCYGQGGGRQELLELLGKRNDPVVFFRHILFTGSPPALLEWAKANRSEFHKCLKEYLIKEIPEELARAFKQLLNSLKDPNALLPSSVARLILEGCNDDIYQLIKPSSNKCALYAYCEAVAKLYSLAGNPRKEGYWLDQLSYHIDEVKDRAIDAAVKLLSSRHNLYQFCHEPEDIIGKKNMTLAENLKDPEGMLSDRRLGGYYGALAGNYAFFGPEHLKITLNYARKALEQGNLRAKNYIAIAYLDAKRLGEAKTAMLDYLQQTGEHVTFVRSLLHDRFSLYALTRFAVEGGFVEGLSVVEIKEYFLSRDGHEFPWQLILYHLGLLAEETKQKEELWRLAVDACLASSLTVKPMALLPLSELEHHCLGKESDLKKGYRVTRNAMHDLNPDHFAPILRQRAWRKALQVARKQKEKLFPFTYR